MHLIPTLRDEFPQVASLLQWMTPASVRDYPSLERFVSGLRDAFSQDGMTDLADTIFSARIVRRTARLLEERLG